ncbi:MAG TPA: PIN domain-containing protein [bacterium]|nr:PIN domain-containing protein [bacterium]HPN34367.1 PIN domain-containing protein [bacterium]
MKGRYFLDTNIFIYSFDLSNSAKQQKANQLIKAALVENKGCISYQVIQEFINVATRKFVAPLSILDCHRYVDSVLYPLCQIFTSIDLYHQALDLMQRWQYSFYDALILAAALQADCTVLYSEDLRHNQSIKSLTILNPFL